MNNKQALTAVGTLIVLLVVLIGGVKVAGAVFASGNHSPSSGGSTTGQSTNPYYNRGQRPGFGNRGPGGFGSFLANAAIGRVTSVNGNTIAVSGFQGTSTTISVNSGTKFQTGSFGSASAATLSDVKVGTFVIARGTKHGSNLTATSVLIRTGGFSPGQGGGNPFSGNSGPPGSGSVNPGSGSFPTQ